MLKTYHFIWHFFNENGPLKRICPSLRCSPPPTAPSSPLGAPRGVQSLQTTSPLQRLLKVGDTSGFLLSVFPALTFTTSLGHASMHEDAVSSPLLRPDACPSLQGDIQSGDPVLVSPLICLTPLPLPPYLEGPASVLYCAFNTKSRSKQ